MCIYIYTHIDTYVYMYVLVFSISPDQISHKYLTRSVGPDHGAIPAFWAIVYLIVHARNIGICHNMSNIYHNEPVSYEYFSTMEHLWDLRISNKFHRGVTEPSSKNTQADDISVLVEEGSSEEMLMGITV